MQVGSSHLKCVLSLPLGLCELTLIMHTVTAVANKIYVVLLITANLKVIVAVLVWSVEYGLNLTMHLHVYENG